MKHFFKILFSVLFFATSVNAQYVEEWRNLDSLSGGYVTTGTILLDSFGNSYMAGREQYPDSMFLEKRDANGLLLWKKYFDDGPGFGYQYPGQMQFDHSGNIVVAGWWNTSNATHKDAFITKYNTTGDIIWTQNYGDTITTNESARYFTINANDDILLSVRCVSVSATSEKIKLFKISSTGNTIWENEFSYNTTGGLGFFNFLTDLSNHIYLVHDTYNGVYNTYYLSRFDSIGTLISDDSLFVYPSGIHSHSCWDGNGNIIVIGDIGGIISKYDALGNQIWELSDPTYNYSDFYMDSDFNLYLIANQNNYLKVRKVNSAGNIIWTTPFLPSNHTEEYGEQIEKAADGTFIISGIKSFIAGGAPDYFFETTLNIDTAGTILSSSINQITNVFQIQNNSFEIDANKNIYYAITANAFGTILKLCSQCLGSLTGTCFNDADSNCVFDSSEVAIAQKVLLLRPENIYCTTNNLGSYNMIADSGAHTLIQFMPNFWGATCNTDSVSFYIPSTFTVDTINFSSQQNMSVNDLSISYGMYPFPNVGAIQQNMILYQNSGTNAINNCMIQLIVDTLYQFQNPVPAPDSVSGNMYYWHFATLNPMDYGMIHFNTYVTPNDSFDVISKNSATIFPIVNDYTPQNNSDSVIFTVYAAYDPNLKSVTTTYGNPNNPLSPLENELAYQINFQNTGTDTATLVRINDTLDFNLDISTIRFGASSAPYTWNISGPGILCFTFNNIMLPDSNVNELLSHGFVKYYIKPKAGLDSGTVIANRASIYFDFNPPVLTKTAFYPEAPVINSVFQSEVSNNSFQVFPNPNAGRFTVKYSLNKNEKAEFVLFNLLGVPLKKYFPVKQFAGENHFEMDLTSMEIPNGIYFLECKTETHKSVSAISIMK